MGDRANIHIIEDGGGDLYFYTHWSGYELPQILAKGLDNGRDRWGDEAYLSRIIFDTLTSIPGSDKTTGFGLSTYRGDYEYDDLVVHMNNQTVTDRDGNTYTFNAFIIKYGNREIDT